MSVNTDNMVLNIDGENFKKLAVAAYATAGKYSDLVYQNILITEKNGYIYAYGTDYYQLYKIRIKCDKTNNASADLRLLLHGDDFRDIANHLKGRKNVAISHNYETPTAKITIQCIRDGEQVEEYCRTVDVYNEVERDFQDSKLDELCNALEYDDIAPIKCFDLVKIEKMSKAIKTAITSAKHRKNMTIEITRSSRNRQEIFTYEDWFDGILMPIKRI